MYGTESLKDRQYRDWFDKFCSEDFSLKDEQCSEQPNEVDHDQIKAIIESDRHITVRDSISSVMILRGAVYKGSSKYIKHIINRCRTVARKKYTRRCIDVCEIIHEELALHLD